MVAAVELFVVGVEEGPLGSVRRRRRRGVQRRANVFLKTTTTFLLQAERSGGGVNQSAAGAFAVNEALTQFA